MAMTSTENRKIMRDPSPQNGAFSLADTDAYQRWRDVKLASHSRTIADLLVEVRQLESPSDTEKAAILDRCRRTNMVIYACQGRCLDESDVRPDLKSFAATFGLGLLEDHRSAGEDGIVALEVTNKGGRAGFIPYTTRPLNWHTDGYYRGPEKRIRAMVLHCVRPAYEGGINGLMDPEIAYIRLRDRNPAFIAALMQPDAMTIPAFEEEGRPRPECKGPVFSVEPDTGSLYMRYTARKRNIVWRDDDETRAAVTALREVLADDADPFRFHHRLEAGMGLLCNNVLHDRSGFENEPGHNPGQSAGRLYYRARYSERIAGT